MNAAQDSVAYSLNQNNLVIQGFNKFTVISVMSEVKMREDYQNEKIWYFLLSQEQALLLRALASRSKQNYFKMFHSLKVSEVVQDPATKLYSLMYRCSQEEIDFVQAQIANSLSGLVALKAKISANVLRLLQIPQSLSPNCSVLSKMQKLHHSVIKDKRQLNQVINDFSSSQKLYLDEEDPKLNLKFKVEGNSCHFQELYVISSSYEENARLLAALNSEVEYLEKYKIHLMDKQSSSQNEEGLLNWEKCGSLVGERLNKTEEGLAFQSRYGVYLFYETKEPKRVVIYGSYNNQRLAYTELASLLSDKAPNRLTIEVGVKGYILIQGSPSKQIEKKMQELCPGLKLFYLNSRERLFFCVIIYEGSVSSRLLRAIYQKVERDVLSTLQCLTIPKDLWEERDSIESILLRNEMQLHYEMNSSLQPKQIVISNGSSPPLWLRSQRGVQEENEGYEEYSIEWSQQIEHKFKSGQYFFEIEDSSFSLQPGRSQTWSQISKTAQYKLKRLSHNSEPREPQITQLGPKEQLIIGFSQEIVEFQQQLVGLKNLVKNDRNLGVAQYLQKKRNQEIELMIESKFGVKTSYQEDLCSVFIKGELRYYAQKELNELYSRIPSIPSDIRFITEEERNRVIHFFLSRWKGSHTPHKIELEKLRNADLLMNYVRERSVLKRRSGKKEVEMELFQEEDNIENEREFFHNISMSIRNKTKQPLSVVLFRVLVGKKLKVKEEREFVAPLKVTKIIQRNKNKLSDRSASQASLNSSRQEFIPQALRFYDILELKTDLGSSFQIFDVHHAYPTYRILFKLKI